MARKRATAKAPERKAAAVVAAPATVEERPEDADQGEQISHAESVAEVKPVRVPAKKAAAGYRVKHGSVSIGAGVLRSRGMTIADAEISRDDASRLIADGTLEKIGGAKAEG